VFDPDEITDAVTFDEILTALGTDALKHGRSRCPVCQNKNPSVLHVDEGQGLYYCHRGSHGGDKARLVEEVQGCSRHEALTFLAELAGIDTQVSGERLAEWKRLKQKERDVQAWAGTVLAVLHDLDMAYRFGGGTQGQRKRVARWIRQFQSLSFDELLAWYDYRHLISDAATEAELALLAGQRKKRSAQMAQAREDAISQIQLLACEATPEEWTTAFEGYFGSKKGKGKKGRDSRGAGGERRDQRADGESDTGIRDHIAVPA
jgi:hypothetical protein